VTIEARFRRLRREHWPTKIEVWVIWFALLDVWPLK